VVKLAKLISFTELTKETNKQGYAPPADLTSLKQLPFYCNTIRNGNCCFTHVVGLPKHPATDEEHPLMPYQVGVFDMVKPKQQIKLHINKARQIGFTELIIRILLYHSFHKYEGGKICIIAGTRYDTTKDIFNRLRAMTRPIGFSLKSIVGDHMVFTNGTEIIGLPADPEAMTGLTKIRAVFMDEAAKWGLIDDKPVMNSIMPIVRSNQSDLFMVSTPKGLRGFFYEIAKGKNDFMMKQYDIYTVQKDYEHDGLYSKDEIDRMLATSVEDPKQEYLNQFVAGRDNIFGDKFLEGEHETGW
jgi:hypothetical protein